MQINIGLKIYSVYIKRKNIVAWIVIPFYEITCVFICALVIYL